ncbi:hypothetical protein VOLCADRAFT_99357, partial [Volvox carteri f. nagariensis]
MFTSRKNSSNRSSLMFFIPNTILSLSHLVPGDCEQKPPSRHGFRQMHDKPHVFLSERKGRFVVFSGAWGSQRRLQPRLGRRDTRPALQAPGAANEALLKLGSRGRLVPHVTVSQEDVADRINAVVGC